MRTFFKDLIGLSCALLCMFLIIFSSCKKDKTTASNVELQVNNYYPNSGKAGTLVTIEGTGFDSNLQNNSVEFGGIKGDVISTEADKLVVRAPEGGKTGMIKIGNGNKNIDAGKYTYQILTVKRVNPANGPAGSHINIYGEGFSSMTNPASVTINGKKALVGSANDTLLVAEVPLAAGSGPIEVEVDGMKARGQDFTFQTISAVKPISGGKGTKVRISGEGFEVITTDNIVDFNGKRARVLEATKGSLLVEAPEGVETGPLAVTINGQRSTGPVFTQVAFPDIVEVSPLSGPAGLQMTIKGGNFSTILDENKVLINGIEVPVTAASGNELKLTLPGGTGSGKVSVIVNDQKSEGPQFKDQQLGVLDITPDNGLSGTSVTITGTGFSTNPGSNTVSFNGIKAQVTAATETRLTVLAPVQVTTGTIRIKVDEQEALAPREFRRAGITTIGTEPGFIRIAVDKLGNVYATDMQKHQIVKISPDGRKMLFAGDPSGQSGNQNGRGSNARFNFSFIPGIVIDNQQNIYVSETANRAIRKITPTGEVTTFAANVGPVGQMAIRADNYILAAIGTTSLFNVSPDGKTASVKSISPFYMDLQGIKFGLDAAGGVYYATNIEYPAISYNPITIAENYANGYGDGEYGAYRDGVGRLAQFSGINAITGNGKGQILVADEYYIRSIDPKTRQVSTFLKLPQGDQDGTLRDARLNSLIDIISAEDGTIYVVQRGGSVRKIFFR
jgi:hypothetical protein